MQKFVAEESFWELFPQASIEEVGRYNPQTTPATVTLDMEKVDTWIRNGAQPTDTVARLIETARKDA